MNKIKGLILNISSILAVTLLLISASIILFKPKAEACINKCNNPTLDIVNNYNLFTFEDTNADSSDIEGRAAVGGDAYFTNYSIGALLPSISGNTLVVGGKVHFVNGAVLNGNIAYGESEQLNNMTIPNGVYEKSNPINFQDVKTNIISSSQTIFNYTSNGTVTNNASLITLNGNKNINIFNVNASDLENASEIKVLVPNHSIVIINSGDDHLNFHNQNIEITTDYSNILFNLPNASQLTMSNIKFLGSIFAPKANVEFSNGVIYGNIISTNFRGTGQINYIGEVDYALFCNPNEPTTVPVTTTVIPTTTVIQTTIVPTTTVVPTIPCTCGTTTVVPTTTLPTLIPTSTPTINPTQGEILGIQSTPTPTPVAAKELANTGLNIVLNLIIGGVILLMIALIYISKKGLNFKVLITK